VENGDPYLHYQRLKNNLGRSEALRQTELEMLQKSPSTLVLVSRQPILAPNKDRWAGDLLIDTLRPRRAKILGSSSPLTKFSCPHLPEVVLSSSFRLIAESCSRVPHGTIQNPKILVSLVLVA
jgi:hypothetical protein